MGIELLKNQESPGSAELKGADPYRHGLHNRSNHIQRYESLLQQNPREQVGIL
ncbi:hypothetical protein SAMN05444955_10796 [Lihuaxuella thermophila]|uniref:Uncharacterized protein n=1 Tax=Lihuaxuella thermophila TaxID=1173111 RepID=A0A1H8EQ34_9BACL|nr:hypothetical protein SAMN05444955_10796 [Lihuaxuella thermophila]